MWNNSSPFLQGIRQPLSNEIIANELRIEGTVPPELEGVLFRTGSNQRWEPARPDRYHWFDGDGMVHGFYISNGAVNYRNKWVRTEGFKEEEAAGRSLYNGIYGSYEVAQPQLEKGPAAVKQVANVNVVEIDGRVLALQEAGRHYYELDRNTLETIGTFDFHGAIDALVTAHIHTDAAKNELLLYTVEPETRRFVCALADKQGNILKQHVVTLDAPAYIHDFMFTENHFVFFFGPINWRPESPDRVPAGKSAWTFDPKQSNRTLVVHRQTGATQWFTDEAYQTTHFVNAYEEDGKMIVDGCVSDLQFADDIKVENFFSFPFPDAGRSPFTPPALYRWTLDLDAGQMTRARVGNFSVEFPRINEKLLGAKHQYGYFAGVHQPKSDSHDFNCLIKHDFISGKTEYQTLEGDRDVSPAEPIFVAKPDAVSEDDGWLLVVWWDPQTNKSELVIHDASDFTGAPLARVKLDHHIPLGFHGNWIP